MFRGRRVPSTRRAGSHQTPRSDRGETQSIPDGRRGVAKPQAQARRRCRRAQAASTRLRRCRRIDRGVSASKVVRRVPPVDQKRRAKADASEPYRRFRRRGATVAEVWLEGAPDVTFLRLYLFARRTDTVAHSLDEHVDRRCTREEFAILRTDEPLVEHTVEERQQRIVVAVHVEQADRLVVNAELTPGENFAKLVHRAIATRQRDE